ncbi:hypothetical protein C5E07_12400 [Pseudoclavibacter sp. RFBJ3]|nr:hypothetical protein C5C12_11475 [Pseudoclavibacter sp. RFBJ5]PPF91398.1 hypothetical protein C5E07_12400 [Pseudoclavibacter sp. RFBJ3]PPF96323.1 hypothetical protein C5C19_15090 [Pseudoclavibacter sp. RFBH5]PPG22069.1 hypothetical protein C5E13_11725 [Pseudoclavibacter sp. RFBI4]
MNARTRESAATPSAHLPQRLRRESSGAALASPRMLASYGAMGALDGSRHCCAWASGASGTTSAPALGAAPFGAPVP